MKSNLYDAAGTATLAHTALTAQNIDAIAVYLPQQAMVGGSLLAAGNYTISTLRGAERGPGQATVLRFQSELGESYGVMVSRDYLPIDQCVKESEVRVASEDDDTLRVVRVAIAGHAYAFVIAETFD